MDGPGFAYHHAPELFLGRIGYGPLRVAWDTNVLVDFLEYGRALVNDTDLQVAEEKYEAELLALGQLMEIRILRDIEFHLFDRALTDAKATPPEGRVEAIANAIDRLAEALALDPWEDEDGELWPIKIGHETSLKATLAALPDGADRELVSQALEERMHVFLTRDGGVLKQRQGLAQFGLLLARPTELLDALIDCGAMDCLYDFSRMTWPVPDLQRMSTLLEALEAEEDA